MKKISLRTKIEAGIVAFLVTGIIIVSGTVTITDTGLTTTESNFTLDFDNDLIQIAHLSVKNISNIRIASNYADSGSGIYLDPYINCLKNAYANMSSTSKGVIYFAKGVYEETECIVVDGDDYTKPNHLAIHGAGFWDSIIMLCDDFDDSLITCINQGSVHIEAVLISGNKQNQNVKKPLLYLRHPYDFVIRDTFISSAKGHSIQVGDENGIYGAWAGDIINCPIEYGDSNGINITRASNIYIESCTFGSNQGYNINIESPNIYTYATAIISGNYLSSLYNDSIHLGYHSSGIISENWFVATNNSHNGIIFDGRVWQSPDNLIISSNKFEGNYGLYFESGSGRNIIIEGNDFTRCNNPCNTPILIRTGRIVNNIGLNPLGKYEYPFYGNDYIGLCSSYQSNPNANQNYTVQIAPCRIISTGGSEVNISVIDGHDNLIKNYGATCDVYMEVGWVINFGNFSSTPAVSVYFA